MDGKIVTREIQREIWPVLKREGFSNFTGRTCWRYSPLKIDVVNFQSFTSYLAERIGCTTFSFALNLGCFLNFVPSSLIPLTMKGNVPTPKEYECHLRSRLQKSIRQPELKRRDTWFIGKDGRYLAESVADALTEITARGLPWFERFGNKDEILRTLREDDEGDTWGFGAKDSPIRHVLLGCAEQSSDNQQAAMVHFSTALNKLSKASFEMVLTTRLKKHIAELSGQ